MIKALVFDLGGVYFNEINFQDYAFEKYNANKEETTKLIEKIYYKNAGDARKAGEFWNAFVEKNGLKVSGEKVKNDYFSNIVPQKKVVEKIRELRKDYSVLYLSNSNADMHSWLQDRYDFMSDFDGGILSHEKPYWKPDERIYHDIIVMAQCKPEEIVFVDDRDANTTAAWRLKMKILDFRNAEEFIREIDEMLNLDKINDLGILLSKNRNEFRKKLVEYLKKIKEEKFEYAGYISSAVDADDEYIGLADLDDPALSKKELIRMADKWIKKLGG